MSEVQKTAIICIVAVLTAGLAFWATYEGDAGTDELAALAGKPFFPEFTKPDAIAGFEVIAYDPKTAKQLRLDVQRTADGWRITSHDNYPADVEKRLARVAAALMGVKRRALITRRISDHASLRAEDPLDEAGGGPGTGGRIIVRNADGAVLADYIVGNRLSASQAAARELGADVPHHFVRLPNQPDVWLAAIDLNRLPTAFIDWINPDLLQTSPDDAMAIRLETFNVDETPPTQPGGLPRYRVSGRQSVFLARETERDPWRMLGQPPDRDANSFAVQTWCRDASRLRIAGARRRPAWLREDLTPNYTGVQSQAARDELTLRAMRLLRERGFIFARTPAGPQLLPDGGRVFLRTRDGIEYQLSIGEVLAGTPDAVALPSFEEKPAEDGKRFRYVIVRVRFDSALVAPPENREDKRAEANYRKRIAAGREKAERLQKQCADWFYIVDAESLDRLRRSRNEFLFPAEPRVPLVAPRP